MLRQAAGKSSKTNIIHLKRFSGESSTGGDAGDNDGEDMEDEDEEQEPVGAKEFIYYSSIEQRVCDMLSSARQNILRESEVNRTLVSSILFGIPYRTKYLINVVNIDHHDGLEKNLADDQKKIDRRRNYQAVCRQIAQFWGTRPVR